MCGEPPVPHHPPVRATSKGVGCGRAKLIRRAKFLNDFARMCARAQSDVREDAVRASRMSIRSGSDREGVTRRINWPGRIVQSERTL